MSLLLGLLGFMCLGIPNRKLRWVISPLLFLLALASTDSEDRHMLFTAFVIYSLVGVGAVVGSSWSSSHQPPSHRP